MKSQIIWFLLVLTSNSFNILTNSLIEIAFEFTSGNQLIEFMKRWDINLKLWYNMLILNNGVALFLLYRNLSRAKEKAINANHISICEENSSKNGVKTINRIFLLS